MTAMDFEGAVASVLQSLGWIGEGDRWDVGVGDVEAEERVWRGVEVSTFEERGVLTRNRGLVVTLANGDEFQVTIVQSDRGEADGEEGDE